MDALQLHVFPQIECVSLSQDFLDQILKSQKPIVDIVEEIDCGKTGPYLSSQSTHIFPFTI